MYTIRFGKLACSTKTILLSCLVEDHDTLDTLFSYPSCRLLASGRRFGKEIFVFSVVLSIAPATPTSCQARAMAAVRTLSQMEEVDQERLAAVG